MKVEWYISDTKGTNKLYSTLLIEKITNNMLSGSSVIVRLVFVLVILDISILYAEILYSVLDKSYLSFSFLL